MKKHEESKALRILYMNQYQDTRSALKKRILITASNNGIDNTSTNLKAIKIRK